jgi:RNA polymerase sigma-70 factor (ECF subfamily)
VKLFKTNISSLSDEALMSRLIKSDDNKALTELYARYSTKLLGFFIKMFKGDVSKSQDFLQDIFVKIIEKKHLFDTERKFYSWVFTVANNMCMTEFRKPFIVSISSDHAEHENLVVNDEEAMDKKMFKQALKRTV